MLNFLREVCLLFNFIIQQARKGFRPLSAMQGIGYFQNLRKFLRNCVEIFWIFFGMFLEDFLEEFFGRSFLGDIFWKNFFGGFFWEDFFGKIFFGRNYL